MYPHIMSFQCLYTLPLNTNALFHLLNMYCIALNCQTATPSFFRSLSFHISFFLVYVYFYILSTGVVWYFCVFPSCFLNDALWVAGGRSLVERKMIELNLCSIFTFLGPKSAKSSLIVLSTKWTNSETNTNSARSDVPRSHIGWAFLVGTQKGHCKVCGLRKQLVVSSTSSSPWSVITFTNYPILCRWLGPYRHVALLVCANVHLCEPDNT